MLAKHCIQGAQNINRILTDLWVQGSIIMLGFTNALHLFTSTMVLLISSALPSGSPQDNDEIDSAYRLLESMREHGNITAVEFSEQLSLIRRDLAEWTGRGLLAKVSSATDVTEEQVATSINNSGGGSVSLTNEGTLSQSFETDMGSFDRRSSFHMDQVSVQNEVASWPSFGASPLQPSFYLQADSNALNPPWLHEVGNPPLAQVSLASGIEFGSTVPQGQPGQGEDVNFGADRALDSLQWAGNEMEYLVSLADMNGSDVHAFTFLWE